MANDCTISQISYLDENGWCDFANYATSLSHVAEPRSVISQEFISDQSLVSNVKTAPKCPKRSIAGDRVYYCNDCGSSFTNSSNLKSHSRIHSGERPYVCDVCGASFVQSSNMKAHKRTHTGERPYECKECSQSFSRSSHLTGHMRTHTGERPYICGICEDSFVTSTHLRNHMKKHTGERPFSCSECGATFVLNNILQVHMRIHTGERPYKCGICNSAFRSKGDLRGHYKLHTDDRPFNCSKCLKPFKTKQYLKKHLKYCGAPPTGKRRGRPKKNNVDENFLVEQVDSSVIQIQSNKNRPIVQSLKTAFSQSKACKLSTLKANSDHAGSKIKNIDERNKLGSVIVELFNDGKGTDLSGFHSPETFCPTVIHEELYLQEPQTVTSISVPISFPTSRS